MYQWDCEYQTDTSRALLPASARRRRATFLNRLSIIPAHARAHAQTNTSLDDISPRSRMN